MPEGDIPLFTPPVDKFHYARTLSRSIFHIIHLLVAFILFVIIIPDNTDDPFRTPLLYYLTPIVFVVLFTDTFNLVGFSAPVFITSHLGIFNTLRGRGFIYQAGGALAFAAQHSRRTFPESIFDGIGLVVMEIGIALFSLGVLAHDFGLEDWVEPIKRKFEESTDTLTPVLPETAFRRTAAAFRIITHIIHLFVALLFFAIVISTFNRQNPADPLIFILYLIPLIIIVLAIELCHLFLRTPPDRLTNPLGALNSLWGRGFIYQAAAALAFAIDRSRQGVDFPLDSFSILILITWAIGLTMFVFGILASAFNLNAWIEEPTTQSIRLEDSDREEANVGLPPDHSE